MALQIEILDGVGEVGPEEWNRLVGDASPFLEWEWLASLEESGAVGRDRGWLAHPLVVREGGRLVAAAPLYVKGHSEGEFVFDWSWADAAQRAGIDYYPKLLVGVPFTPVTGARFLVADDVDDRAMRDAMAGALQQFCRDNDFSGVHVNFCLEDELGELEARDYMTRIGIQYHWHNDGFKTFEDYLQRFRSKRRNQIRRERRELDRQGVTIERLTGDAIPDDVFEPVFQCYLRTIDSRYWGRQYLDFGFFELLRDRFCERLVFIVAKYEGEVIAATFNVSKGDALYGRYWGALQPMRHLHFNVCYYAGIEHCIDNGLARFEPGAGGDYKQLRGFDAQPTYSSHYLVDDRLSHAVSRFLEQEREDARHAVERIRADSALKPGPAQP